MRIIGGSARGRTLHAPSGDTTRPTADRVRESLFNILGPPPPRILDLFAGSGALGLESLSRGAQSATFVDRDSRAISAIKRNIAAMKNELVDRHVSVLRGEAIKQLDRLAHGGNAFDWIFVDPPYESEETSAVLAKIALFSDRLLTATALVIVEFDRRIEPVFPGRFTLRDRRKYGDTEIAFLECLPLESHTQ